MPPAGDPLQCSLAGPSRLVFEVRLYQRRSATYLGISGDIKESEIDHARSVVEEELEMLLEDDLSVEEFTTEREALVRRLYTNYIEANDLTGTVRSYFYDRSLYTDFPDLIDFYNSQTLDQTSAFTRESFAPEREIQGTVYPQRISQELMIVACAFLLWLVLLMRLGYFGYLLLWSRVLSGIDNFWTQCVFHGLALMMGTFLLFVALGQVPRKLFVFEDELRIKSLLYAYRRVDPGRIKDVVLRGGPDVWCSRRILGCRPLTLGIISPGLYLRIRGGGSWYFRVRRTEELRDLIAGLIQGARTLEEAHDAI